MMQEQDIVCVASANWDDLWVNAQHMMHRLALSNRVLYVESLGLRSPSLRKGGDGARVWHRLRSSLRGLRQPDPERELYLASPLIVPLHHHTVIRKFNAALLQWQLCRHMHTLGMSKPLLWIFLPTGADLAGKLNEKGMIYYCVDDYKQNPNVDFSTIEALEDKLLQHADIVFATSKHLYEGSLKKNPNTFYTPNAADVTGYARHYESPPETPLDLQNLPKPILGFTGNIADYKVDLEMIRYLAACRPQWSFVLIGPIGHGDSGTDIHSLQQLPNVHWLGRKEKEELPHYVRCFDVGLIPYRLNDSTHSSFPMKFYEYMAAGIPIVSTRLSALAEYEGKLLYCRLANHRDDFLAAVEEYLKLDHGKDTKILRRQEAGKFDWDKRIEFISEKIRERLP